MLKSLFAASVILAASLTVTSCGGGASDAPVIPQLADSQGSTESPSGSSPPATATQSVVVSQTPAFESKLSTTRFLTQATFGPTPDDIARLTGTSASDWFVDEINKSATLSSTYADPYFAKIAAAGNVNKFRITVPSLTFWRNAVTADDQLRQRMAFALSEILVVSAHRQTDPLRRHPDALVYYQDILIKNAFGNYRDLLEQVTYSPAMGEYLTYRGNQKEDPATGRMPDENYAREFLQLFTVGLVELNADGTPKTDASGHPIEVFDNGDITGLAKVFTGLDVAGGWIGADEANRSGPMIVKADRHSTSEKSFLGFTIAAGTPLKQSIDLALDHVMAHENVGPFVSRQLIQRFTTSDPDPDYVQRVSSAFNNGTYQLPDGTSVGDGRKGDLSATLAAILFDEDANYSQALGDGRFGKVREPIIRVTNWARAFDANATRPELILELWDTSDASQLNQSPYRAPSVFNFFRPSYEAPGSESGAAEMTVPELQILNASSVPGYLNYMTDLISGRSGHKPTYVTLLGNTGYTPDGIENYFYGNYSTEIALADDAAALISHLNELLVYGQLSLATQQSIESAIEGIPAVRDGLSERVEFAILLVMSTPEYLVQK